MSLTPTAHSQVALPSCNLQLAFHRTLATGCLLRKRSQWGFLQKAMPSLPLFILLRLPKNVRERQYLMFFFPGAGVEQELPDILGQLSWLHYHTHTCMCTQTHTRKEKKSQSTLRFSLLSSASSFNFHSRTVGQNTSQVITSALALSKV